MPQCPLCNFESDKVWVRRRALPDVVEISCPSCGNSVLTDEALEEIGQLPVQHRLLIASWVSHRALRGLPVATIASSKYARGAEEAGTFNVDELLDVYVTDNVSEQINDILLGIASASLPGQVETFDPVDQVRFYSRTEDQMIYYLEALVAQGWCELIGGSYDFRITAQGWSHVARLQDTPSQSRQVFVAMFFATELDTAWRDGFEEAISATGLVPLRVDKKEHNEKICDVIVAEIRKSRLLVADVTLHRQGVYFEAGFAMGLGLQVVWTCRRDNLDACHFDTRQYSHVVWDTPEDLARRLRRRLEATAVLT
jgi:hypothetical protein